MPGFLKLVFFCANVCVCVCVCVCACVCAVCACVHVCVPPLRLLIIIGMMWCDMDAI